MADNRMGIRCKWCKQCIIIATLNWVGSEAPWNVVHEIDVQKFLNDHMATCLLRAYDIGVAYTPVSNLFDICYEVSPDKGELAWGGETGGERDMGELEEV